MNGSATKVNSTVNAIEVNDHANAIEVNGLTKKYGTFTAVDGVSFSVKRGALFAFLGPNGAGKSTTVNCLTTFLSYEGGGVKVLGFDCAVERDKIRSQIGAVFQESVLDGFLTVKENIRARAALYGIDSALFNARYGALRENFSLAEIENKRFCKLSGGQKRRADIARALINSPKILFLDEPTTGLDPQTRLAVWENIRRFQESGDVTVFLTTHYMEEAAKADFAVIIDKGKIIAADTPENLIDKYSGAKLKIKPKDGVDPGIFGSGGREKNGVYEFGVSDCFEALERAKKFKKDVEFFEIVNGNMDDVFISLTGGALRDNGEDG
jgi:multidrug/hemolysin transport system ATP-binding protein